MAPVFLLLNHRCGAVVLKSAVYDLCEITVIEVQGPLKEIPTWMRSTCLHRDTAKKNKSYVVYT